MTGGDEDGKGAGGRDRGEGGRGGREVARSTKVRLRVRVSSQLIMVRGGCSWLIINAVLPGCAGHPP